MTVQGITRELIRMGISPQVVKMVEKGAGAGAPKMSEKVVKRLISAVSRGGKAVLVLSKKGKYSVFTPEGLAAISASTKKNKPWESRKKTVVH